MLGVATVEASLGKMLYSFFLDNGKTAFPALASVEVTVGLLHHTAAPVSAFTHEDNTPKQKFRLQPLTNNSSRLMELKTNSIGKTPPIVDKYVHDR
jgi:hypothetical protein